MVDLAGRGQFPTSYPLHVIEEAAQAAREGFTKYTPNVGFFSLREKLMCKLKARSGLDVIPDEIIVTPGAVCGLATLLAAMLDPGDEVLAPDPGWPNYQMMVIANRGRPVLYPLHRENRFLPDLADLEVLANQRTKALIVNSPSNPTGAVFPE